MPCVSSDAAASSTTSGNRTIARASGRLGRTRQVTRDGRRRRQAGVGRLAQDRRDPGVGVLDVVDGVLGRLPPGQVDVDVHVEVGAAGGEEPAGGIDPDVVEERVEQVDVAGSLGHRTTCPSRINRHPARQQDLDVSGSIPRPAAAPRVRAM